MHAASARDALVGCVVMARSTASQAPACTALAACASDTALSRARAPQAAVATAGASGWERRVAVTATTSVARDTSLAAGVVARDV